MATTISWHAYGNTASWEYTYDVKGFDPDIASTYTIGDTIVSMVGLSDNTEYDFYVRTLCSDNEQSLWRKYSFRTLCGTVAQFPYVESFEDTDDYKVCWTVIDGNDDGTTWSIKNAGSYAKSGNNSYIMETSSAGTDNDDYLITPALELTGNEYISYNIRQYGGSYSYRDNFRVLLSVTGTDTSDFTIELQPTERISNHNYTEHVIDLAPYQGTCYIAFHVPAGSPRAAGICIDDVTIGAYPACLTPYDVVLSDYTSNSVTLTWTQLGTPDFWQIAFDTADHVNFRSIFSNPYVLGGLTTNEIYDVYIRAGCGFDFTSWSKKVTIMLPCETVTALPFVETFESNSATLPCWRTINNNQDENFWQIASDITYANPEFGGNSYATMRTMYRYGNNDDYLITPPIQLTGNEVLRYFVRAARTGSPNDYDILLSTTGFEPEDFTDTLLPLTTISAMTYQEEVLSLNGYSGKVYIAFHIPYDGLNGQALYIDDVSIEPYNNCAFPRFVIASDQGRDTVNIRWTPQGSETNWEYVVVPMGNAPGSVSPTSVTDTFTTVSGLSPGTYYDVYVRALCGGSNTSLWSRAVSFRTDCNPITILDLPYKESFDSYFPENDLYVDCWKRFTNTAIHSTYISSASSISASNSLYFNANHDTVYTYAVLPDLDESIPMDTIMVQFYLHSGSTSAGIIIGTMLHSNDVSTFTAVDTIYPSITGQFNRESIFFRNYSGTGRSIAFKYIGVNSAVYMDDLVVDYIPTCLYPTEVAVDNATSSSISLVWTENRSATQWEIECCAPGVSHGLGDRVIANTHPFTVPSLNSNTSYTLYVRSICAPGDTSDWSIPITATTLCAFYSLPFEEDFNGDVFPPECWSRLSGLLPTEETPVTFSSSTAWKKRNFAQEFSNTPSASLNFLASQISFVKDWLFTPEIDLGNSGDDILLEFDLALRKYNSLEPPVSTGYNDKFMVLMSADDTWDINDVIAVWDNQGSNRVFGAISSASTGERVLLRITGVTGVVKFAFYGETSSSADNDLYVDNISITLAPQIQTYTIIASAGSNGIISPSGTFIKEEGDFMTFAFIPKENYEVDSVIVNNAVVGMNVPSYTILDIDEDKAIHVTFKEVVGIKPYEPYQSIEVFPNPTKGILNIRTQSSFELVEICNSMGQVIDKRIVNDTAFSIDVSSYGSGIYFLHLRDQYGVVTKKFVKE